MDDEAQYRLALMVYKSTILHLKGRSHVFVARKAPKRAAK